MPNNNKKNTSTSANTNNNNNRRQNNGPPRRNITLNGDLYNVTCNNYYHINAAFTDTAAAGEAVGEAAAADTADTAPVPVPADTEAPVQATFPDGLSEAQIVAYFNTNYRPLVGFHTRTDEILCYLSMALASGVLSFNTYVEFKAIEQSLIVTQTAVRDARSGLH